MASPADIAIGPGRGANVPRSTLVAGAAALLLLVLSLMLAFGYFARRDLHIDRRFEDAERALKTLHAIAAREYGVLDQVTARAAALLEGRRFADVPASELARIKEHLEAPVAGSRVWINFWHPDGRGVLPDQRGIDLSDRDFIRAHADRRLFDSIAARGADGGEGFVIGAPVRSRLRDEDVFPVSRAIRDPDGRLAAIVAASIPTRAFFDAVAHQRRTEGDSIFLLRADGAGLLRMPPDPRSAAGGFRESPIFQRYPAQRSGRHYGRALTDGIPHHSAFAGLDPLPLVAGYSFDAAAAAAEARATMFPGIYADAAAVFAAMCFAGLAFAAVRGGERAAGDLSVERDRSIAYAVRLDAILDSASDAILILGPDLRITHYNRAAERVFGVPAAQAIGGTIDRFVPERARPGHAVLMGRQALAPEFSRVMGNWRHVQAQHASGRCFPAMISISKSTDRGTASYMAIVRDTTEQMAAEDRLQRLLAEQEQLAKAASASDAAKSLFLASMSHELRTPLNAIVGYSEALTLGYAGPIGSPKAREYVADILRSGQHLHALIDRVLDLSRIQGGDDVAPGEHTPLAEAIRESLRIVDIRAREKAVQIRIVGDAGGLAVAGDRRRILQILLNVLGNAIKFSPAGGRIELEVARADGPFAARVAVVDSGPGMSAEVLARIGKPFTQERDLMVANNDGVGLGLSIVCEILNRLGGEIRFQNRPQGGLEATVHLAPPAVAA